MFDRLLTGLLAISMAFLVWLYRRYRWDPPALRLWEEGRALLTIAVTAPGAQKFSRIWKVRHQRWPKRRLFAGVFWKGKLFRNNQVGHAGWSFSCWCDLAVETTHRRRSPIWHVQSDH